MKECTRCKEKMSNLTREDAVILMERVSKAERVYNGLRETMHRVDASLKQAEIDLDGIWYHGLDGSDLLVNKTQLFEVTQNVVMHELAASRAEIKSRMKRLAEYIKRNGDIPRM